MPDLWMGIDLGTQGARAVVATEHGTVIGEGASSLASHRDRGRHEQNPDGWWQAVSNACGQATAGIRSYGIRAVALCATSGTFCLVDSRGQAITTGVMYDDNRATSQAERAASLLSGRLGYRIQPGWALAKLLWFLDHDLVPPGARLCHQSDFAISRLVGHRVPADSSHALKTGYDLETDEWPADLFDGLSIPSHLLPDVVQPGSILGSVSRESGEITGIPAGTPVIAGMTDGCAGQIAAGAVEIGSINSVLGTTLVIKVTTADRLIDPSGVTYSHRSPDGQWFLGGASSTGAGVLTSSFGDQDLDSLIEAASANRPARAVAYPLTQQGERFPFLAPKAEGLLLGNRLDIVEHCAALIQGVAYVERLALDHMSLHGADLRGPYFSTGGGTRSHTWCQVRTDIVGRLLRLPQQAGSAFGMALLASATEQGSTLAAAARDMVATSEEFDPAPDAEFVYRPNYLRLVDALAERGWITEELAIYASKREWTT